MHVVVACDLLDVVLLLPFLVLAKRIDSASPLPPHCATAAALVVLWPHAMQCCVVLFRSDDVFHYSLSLAAQ